MTRARIDSCEITNNTGFGIEEGVNGTKAIVSGACVVLANTAGQFSFNTDKRYHLASTVVDFEIGSGDGIASATTITLPEGGEFFDITGTTTITTITASRRGRIVTLKFSGILTMDNAAANLVLAGDFVTTSSDTLTLVCDGTNWIELSRSVN
jgi:hypothetical protein